MDQIFDRGEVIFRTQNENNPLFLLGEIPQLILIALCYFMICDGNKALFGILGRNEMIGLHPTPTK